MKTYPSWPTGNSCRPGDFSEQARGCSGHSNPMRPRSKDRVASGVPCLKAGDSRVIREPFWLFSPRAACPVSFDCGPTSVLPLSAAAIKPIKSEPLSDMLHLERIVDRVLWRSSLKDRHDVLSDYGGHVAQPFLGLGGAMGGEHDIGAADERMVGGGRFFREDVGPITPETAGGQGFGNGVLVHDRTAAGVDQDGVRARQCKGGTVDHPSRTGIERNVQRDVV